MAIRTRQEHHTGFSRPPVSGVYKKIAFSFLGLTILVVIGALWVSSVYARVQVKVKRETTDVQAAIEVAKMPEQGQLSGRVVQGVFEKIQEFAVKDQQEAPVDTVVRGTVKIINKYSKSQTLVKTTRLLTADGRLYRIDKTITVDPNESIQVPAYSDQPGKQYILPAGTHFTIPGLWPDLQKHIYAESTSGFTGGTQLTRIVSNVDVEQAQKVLEDAVFEQAQKTLKAEAGAGDDWKVVYIKKVLEKKNNVSTGQQADQFLASVKLDVTAVYYPEKDMDVLIRQKLREKLPEGRELVDFDPALVVYKIDQADPKLERARISISAQASSRLTANSAQLSEASILGLSLDDAKAKLTAIDGVESVDIRIRPSWIHTLPKSKEKIDFVVE